MGLRIWLVVLTLTFSWCLTPPPLLDGLTSWVVFTNTTTLADGTLLQYSAGQVVTSIAAMNSVCLQKRQSLIPPEPGYHLLFDNLTTGVQDYQDFLSDGTLDKCGRREISKGKVLPGGGRWLSPPADLLPNMTFVGYELVDKINSSHWHYETSSLRGLSYRLEWYTSVTGGLPLLYINHSFNSATNITMEFTSAYDGCQIAIGFPTLCTEAYKCEGLACVSNPNATPQQLDSAINWACSDGGVDCYPILPGGDHYYPNTLQAHGNYAFGTYYTAHRQQGSGACDFGGAAVLVPCDLECEHCLAKPTATDDQLNSALTWICGPDGIQNCDPIKPGGKHYLPNTPRDHANWAFDYYFSVYRCAKGPSACDIQGASVIQPCNVTGR